MADDPLHAIELMVSDNGLQGRVRAAVAKEAAYGSIPPQPDPAGAAFTHRYAVAAAPGWGAAYQYALDTDNSNPGTDPGVITDAQIQAQVVELLKAPPEPDAT